MSVVRFVDPSPTSSAPILRLASNITPRELDPLWPGVLWRGKPTLLVGDPGLGKSLVTVDMAARVSRGTPWPCEIEERVPGDVLMLSAEDDADDTIVPRLLAAGADLERVTFLDGIRTTDEQGDQTERPVSLDVHMALLRDAVLSRRGAVQLLIVDPISAFLGKSDSHNNAEVRALLAALGRLAAELRFAVLVVSHLNKGSGANSVYRVTGSLAFVAAARAVFAITRDPDETARKLMLPVKSNLGPDASGYSYTVSVADNDTPHVRWGDERIERTADDVLASVPTPREKAIDERRRDVEQWLREQLIDGQRLATAIKQAAKAAGISVRDLDRAQRELGVLKANDGFRGPWYWSLPTRQTSTPVQPV